MQAIAELGRRVDERWRAAGYRAGQFTQIAAAELGQLMNAGAPSGDEIARWAIDTVELPRQANVPASFGQPPITLYRTDKFYIEALYWLDGTTAIHDHAFAGAFAVLGGSSLHSTFQFEQTDYVDDRLRLGTLTRKASELLEEGAVRPIVAGRSFVHSLFHLDRPSVSLTVRTYADADVYPQLEYRAPGLAMDSSYIPEGPTRRLAVLDMLADSRSGEFVPALRAALEKADLLQCFRAIEQTAVHPYASRELPSAFRIVRDRFPEQADLVQRAVEETLRQRNIHGRRELIHQSAHRFLLALLLNIPDRDDLLAMVTTRTGCDDPIAQVVTWMRELAADGAGTLGISLDDSGLATFEGMLRGWSEETICKQPGTNLVSVAKWGLTLPRTHLLRGLLH